MVAEDVMAGDGAGENVTGAEVTEVKEISVLDALKQVLKKALIFDGLRRGLHEWEPTILSDSCQCRLIDASIGSCPEEYPIICVAGLYTWIRRKYRHKGGTAFKRVSTSL